MNPTEIFGFPETYITVQPLNIAAFVYLAACLAYIVAVARSGFKSQGLWDRTALVLSVVGLVVHTLGLLGRWYVGGINRPPWTNLYESLVAFAWGLALFHVVLSIRWRVSLVGVLSMPLVFLLMGMAVMTPNKSVEPLIPALQSYWLKIHVLFGIIAYAGFTVSAVLAFFQLFQAHIPLRKLGAGISGMMILCLALAGGYEVYDTGHFYLAKTVLRKMPDGSEKYVKDTVRDPDTGSVVTNMERVPQATPPFHASWILFLAAALAFSAARGAKRNDDHLPGLGKWLFGGGVLSLLWLFGAMSHGVRSSATISWGSNPYLVMLLVTAFLIAILFLTMCWRAKAFRLALPTEARLDELSYKNILFAFPFQTLLLVTGAVWAYYAWGRSWGWDPKETWALITWLAFLIYLHGKLLLKWSPVWLSINALIGFVIMVFAFLGVNLVLSGLHSYGAA